MSANKKYIFHGDAYEEQNNSNKKILNTGNISGGDNIDVDVAQDGKSVTVSSKLPVSVQNGMLMVTFERDTENNEEVDSNNG
jgi:hypothetical protein